MRTHSSSSPRRREVFSDEGDVGDGGVGRTDEPLLLDELCETELSLELATLAAGCFFLVAVVMDALCPLVFG